MSNVKHFTNDNFATLAYLYDNKGKDDYARITQGEVATALGLSMMTMNGIFKQLKEDEYIIPDATHPGRYLITAKAINAVKAFRAADKK